MSWNLLYSSNRQEVGGSCYTGSWRRPLHDGPFFVLCININFSIKFLSFQELALVKGDMQQIIFSHSDISFVRHYLSHGFTRHLYMVSLIIIRCVQMFKIFKHCQTVQWIVQKSYPTPLQKQFAKQRILGWFWASRFPACLKAHPELWTDWTLLITKEPGYEAAPVVLST
jgi:hypothetical protein